MAIIRRRAAMGPLQVAIDTVVMGDVTLVGRIDDRAYSLGTVPKDVVAPWLEYGDSNENALGTFGRGGNVNEETITITVDRTEGKLLIADIYDDLVRLFDLQPIAIEGHATVRARVELVTVFNDPDGIHTRGVVRLRVQSLTSA
jgi:hypothetical protein